MDVVVVAASLPPVELQGLPQSLLPVDPAVTVEDQELKTPKRRAETWAQDEIKALIALRKEMDNLFNTSKSNKHLWEQISTKMRQRGYERSATMCTDKWRNLLKEFKKVKQQDRGGSAKVACYKDLEELLEGRAKLQSHVKPSTTGNKEPPSPLVTPATRVTTQATLNLERQLNHDGHPHAVCSTDPLAHGAMMSANGLTPTQLQWNWRDPNSNGGERSVGAVVGKVIVVKCAEMTKRIRIDGPYKSIKEAIKTSFGLRSRRPFWLEDEGGVVQTISRDIPQGQYTLNLDPGITIKVCVYDEADRMTGNTESRTLYTENDFRELLTRRGWSGLREVGGFRDIDCLEELRTGTVYQRAGLLVA